MSTNKSSGDRSDVPDLLKSLADYPFSFPDFEDTGKFFCTCGKCTFGAVYIINQKCVILTVTWYNTAVLSNSIREIRIRLFRSKIIVENFTFSSLF